MKPATLLFIWVFGTTVALSQSTGGPYTIATASLDPAGGRATAGVYRNDAALGATGSQTAASSAYQAASGYPSTLRDATGIRAIPGAIPEDTATQLTLRHLLDDGTQLAISSTGAAWSVLNGPLSVNATGLVTTQSVPVDTNGTMQVTLGPLTSPTTLTIQDTIPDNFGLYAGDGLSDSWQVAYFGLNNPLAAPGLDPDGDGLTNLFEFIAGLLPNSNTSRFTFALENVPGQPGQKRMVFQPAISGRTFTLLKSTTLLPGSWLPVPGAVTVGNDGTQTLTDPAASDGRAFYQVQINVP